MVPGGLDGQGEEFPMSDMKRRQFITLPGVTGPGARRAMCGVNLMGNVTILLVGGKESTRQ
jgi:hypothetical protein